MKLHFVCIGAQKAGTTTLHDILKQHPNIYLPPKKEAHFCDVNELYEKGVGDYFSRFYDTYSDEKFIGNINPNLQIENRSLDRLAKTFGRELKIIFILRNPVYRAYSHYQMSKSRGYEDLSFKAAIEMEKLRINNPKFFPDYKSKEPGHFEKNHFGYIGRSSYLATIKKLYQLFPKENIKVILFEDFISKQKIVIADILNFLNIPPFSMFEYNVKSNFATEPKNIFLRDILYKPNPIKKIISYFLTKNIKETLKKNINYLNSRSIIDKEKHYESDFFLQLYNDRFKNDIKEIESITGLNCDVWLKDLQKNLH